MQINVQGFLDSLPIMGIGMVGIFIVTLIIVVVVSLLNKFTTPKNKQ